MTLATQPEPAAALRASLTCTTPRGPLMVPPSTVSERVPRLPASLGTVIDRAPPVTVTVAALWPGPAAEAGRATPNASSPAIATRSRLRIRTFQTIDVGRHLTGCERGHRGLSVVEPHFLHQRFDNCGGRKTKGNQGCGAVRAGNGCHDPSIGSPMPRRAVPKDLFWKNSLVIGPGPPCACRRSECMRAQGEVAGVRVHSEPYVEVG